MKEYSLSIICLVYNHENYLRKTLDGFVNQKTKYSYEVIIHDDASTDASPQIIKEYEEKYPDIFHPIYQKENQYSQGKKITLDYIVPKLKGKYIAFCEGDDYWCNENKIEVQIDFLEKNLEYSGITHQTAIIDNDGKFTGEYVYDCFIDKDIENFDSFLSFPHISSFVLRNPWLEKNIEYLNYAKYISGLDKTYAIYMLKTGKVRYLCDVYSHYRHVTNLGTSTEAREARYNLTVAKVQYEYALYNQLKYYHMLDNDKYFYSDHYFYNVYMYSIRKFIKNPSVDNWRKMLYGVKKSPYPYRIFLKYLFVRIFRKIKKNTVK